MSCAERWIRTTRSRGGGSRAFRKLVRDALRRAALARFQWNDALDLARHDRIRRAVGGEIAVRGRPVSGARERIRLPGGIGPQEVRRERYTQPPADAAVPGAREL